MALTMAISGIQLHRQISNCEVSPGSKSLHPPPICKPHWAEGDFQGDLREGFKVSIVKEKVQEHMCIRQITIH